MMNERSVTFGRIGRAKYSEDGPINFHLLNRKSKTNLVFSMWQAAFDHVRAPEPDGWNRRLQVNASMFLNVPRQTTGVV